MQRRKFVVLLSSAATVWPLAAYGQQSAMPVVGFPNAASPQTYPRPLAAFLKGLKEAGYIDGQNVTILYRWAEGENDRLPAMAAELVNRQVTVIAATTALAALAAKAATSTIPVVFETGGDPIKLGLVASFSRPGGNVTGATSLGATVIAAKGLELMHELIPAARVMGLLVNPTNPLIAEPQERELSSAAHAFGLEIHILKASTEHDFEGVFAKLVDLQASGLYTGRVLNGEKPADLPVQQATKVELVINLKAANALGVTVPVPLLGRADEVIE